MGSESTPPTPSNSDFRKGDLSDAPTRFVSVHPPCFSIEELNQFQELVIENSRSAIVKGRGGKTFDGIRRSEVLWLDTPEYQWVFERLWQVATEANKVYQYRIDRFEGPVQLTIYDSKNQGFYRWHSDIAPRSTKRKISITMPLNEPSEYEGGSLEFNGSGSPSEVPQHQGTVITFPSFVLHRVTPVTRGKRFSLVAWITGPPWS